MRGFFADKRANAMVLFGILAPLLFAAGGMAVDYAHLTRLRADLQSTADSAALAGARQMLSDAALTESQQATNARGVAEKYVLSMAAEAAKDIQASASDRAVTVKLSQTKQLYFGGLFGRAASAVAVTATATYTPANVVCLLALEKAAAAAIDISGSARVSGPKCTMWANSNSSSALTSSGSATATARVVGTAGGATGAGAFSPAPKTFDRVVEDPYAGRYLPPESTACRYTGFTVSGGASSVPMSPGVYCNGLQIHGDATLSAGTYYIYNSVFEVRGSPNITGLGITIVLVGTSYLDWSGGGTLNLSAPTSGPYAGLLIVSDPNGPALKSTMQGNVSTSVTLQGTFNGSIYLPNQQLAMGGNSSINLANTGTKIVARSIAVAGSALVTLGSDDTVEIATGTKNLRLIK